jgi:glycosyltransferase involved in cell wall biosynthesis
MEQPISVSVVIRCRNEEAHIGRLLTGLIRQSHRPDEIILVDSGSTDATLSIASAFPVSVVHISHDEFSFGAACNLGFEEATSDVVVLVSAHCYPVYDSWIARLVEPFADRDVALAYGRQTGPPHARFSEQRLFSRWFPSESVRRQRHPFCNNANAAVRRSVWESGLRYDEHLTGLEDLDWAKRTIAAGHVMSYVAEAPVVHVHEESFDQVVNRYRREAIAHRQIDAEQTIGMVDALRLAAANIVGDLAAAQRRGQLVRNAVDIPRFRIAQFYGTYRGFAQQGPVTALLRERFFFPEGPSDKSAEPVTAERPIDYDEPFDVAELR